MAHIPPKLLPADTLLNPDHIHTSNTQNLHGGTYVKIANHHLDSNIVAGYLYLEFPCF